jgi:5'-deoxynucleotidase YfbR-like HD superfamily hydrolase
LLVEVMARQKNPNLDKSLRLAIFLHDAAEYVIGDMISPFRAALGSGYKDFEAKLEAAIHLRYGLPPKTPQTIKTLIKKADKACAFFEATQLAGFTEKESLGFFGSPPAGYSLVIEPQPAPVAQARYLERYRVLAGAVGLIPADDAWHTE